MGKSDTIERVAAIRRTKTMATFALRNGDIREAGRLQIQATQMEIALAQERANALSEAITSIDLVATR